MKNFVKAMDQNSVGFTYLKKKFPRISDAKIKEGIFFGIQIRELIQDVNSEYQLSEVEKAAWKSCKKSLPILGGIIMQKTIVIWWLIL
jgi:hypothetical protein